MAGFEKKEWEFDDIVTEDDANRWEDGIEEAHKKVEEHVNDTENPHNVDKEDIGLGNVDNTSDMDKPVSNAVKNELNKKLTQFRTVPLGTNLNEFSEVGFFGGNTKQDLLNYPEELTGIFSLVVVRNFNVTNSVSQTVFGLNGTVWTRQVNTSNPKNNTAWEKLTTATELSEAISNLNKSHVGLGNVENYGIATQSEAEAGTSTTKYMVPLRVKQAIENWGSDYGLGIPKQITSFDNLDNGIYFAEPGATSAPNSGGYFVVFVSKKADNAGSQIAIERFSGGGSKLWVRSIWSGTPGNWSEIESSSGSQAKVNAHADNKSNPHGVTKTQVGLGSVPNYSASTQAQAFAGTANNTLMTPLRTQEAIESQTKLIINNSKDRQNPRYELAYDSLTGAFVIRVLDANEEWRDVMVLGSRSGGRNMTYEGKVVETTEGAQSKANTAADAVTNWVKGLGLGEGHTKTIGDLNNATKNGWYVFDNNTENTPHGNSYGVVRVDSRSGGRVSQTAYYLSGSTLVRIYVRFHGSEGWGDWEQLETVSGAQAKVNAHANLTDNPHKVTKAQVGLGNVDNIKQATQAQFNAHIDSTDAHGLGEIAVSIGKDTLVPEILGGAVGIGYKAQVSAVGGLALGYDTAATSMGVALGYIAKAQGGNATSLGSRTTVSGANSTALGSNSSATKMNATALGNNSEAAGLSSVAIGNHASALNDHEGVLGGVTANDMTGRWRIPGTLTVGGIKNFEIPHPHPDKRDTHVLRHTAVESPTAGDNLYRFTVEAVRDNETTKMLLPDYFQYLNKDVDVYVSPHLHFGRAYGVVEDGELKVTCETAGEYKVLVIGTRNDGHQSVQDWDIRGVEREIGESWNGETYVFEVDEIMEVDEIKEEIA